MRALMHSCLLLSIASLVAQEADAGMITFQFTGVLTQVYDETAASQLGSPGGLEGDFGIELGTTFSGTGSFDSEASDGRPEPERGFYNIRNGSFMTLSIGTASFATSSTDGVGVSIENDTFAYTFDPPSYSDWYQVLSAARPALGSDQFSNLWIMAWNLYDPTKTALTSDALVIPPPFEEWESSWFAFNQGSLRTCHPIPWESCNPSLPQYRNAPVRFFGELTSLTFIPEPGTGLLVFAALIGLAAWRRIGALQ
jgi:hypothetical protein